MQVAAVAALLPSTWPPRLAAAASNALVAERPSPPNHSPPSVYATSGGFGRSLVIEADTTIEDERNVFFLVKIVMIMSHVNATGFSAVYRQQPNNKTARFVKDVRGS